MGNPSASQSLTVGLPPCHSGNVKILSIGKGGLWAAGQSKGYNPDGFAFINLVGDHRDGVQALNDSAVKAFAKTLKIGDVSPKKVLPWLSFPMPDFSVPKYDDKIWQAVADEIFDLANDGTKVLVACQGGHGRTGIFTAIVCGLLCPSVKDEPVQYVRKIYCEKAVETREQHVYVHDVLGLPKPPELTYPHGHTFNYGTWTSGAAWSGGQWYKQPSTPKAWGIPWMDDLVAELERLGVDFRDEGNRLTVDTGDKSRVIYTKAIGYNKDTGDITFEDDQGEFVAKVSGLYVSQTPKEKATSPNPKWLDVLLGDLDGVGSDYKSSVVGDKQEVMVNLPDANGDDHYCLVTYYNPDTTILFVQQDGRNVQVKLSSIPCAEPWIEDPDVPPYGDESSILGILLNTATRHVVKDDRIFVFLDGQMAQAMDYKEGMLTLSMPDATRIEISPYELEADK